MKMPCFKLTGLLMLLFYVTCNSHISCQSSPFSYHQFINANSDTLNYRMLKCDADSVTKYPLVVFLHGAGERGNDNESQLKWGVMNFATSQNMIKHPAIVIAPQCTKGDKWAKYANNDASFQANARKPLSLVIELVKETIKKMPVDTNRIYITGLSMGGFGTFDAIIRNPNLFAAAVPVCGGGDAAKASEISHIPLWIFHGAIDASINPDLSHKMVNALTRQGAQPGFTLYPEVGHFAWIAAYSDPMMMDWLFRQHK